jgi:septum formation protein
MVLEAAGLPVEVSPANIDERAIEKASDASGPSDVAMLLAREKAKAVSANRPGRIVIGADQTLALGARRFSKPRDRESARRQLQDLRGRTHELHSAAAVVCDGRVLSEHSAVARLSMRDFSDAFIEAYLDAAGPAVMQSVGGYQLERLGVHLFDRIEGDHFTILGLPLFPLLEGLRRENLLAG